ncbi:hypothetical protein D3C72_1291250 [compost metagenome]
MQGVLKPHVETAILRGIYSLRELPSRGIFELQIPVNLLIFNVFAEYLLINRIILHQLEASFGLIRRILLQTKSNLRLTAIDQSNLRLLIAIIASEQFDQIRNVNSNRDK